MAPALALLAAALVGRSVAVSFSDAKGQTLVTPLQQVLNMLEEMNAKGKSDKHDEEVEFAKFHEWCDGVRASRTKSIKEATGQILQLEADIQKAESDAETLAEEIAGLEAAIAKAEAEIESATGIRNKEEADYIAGHKDLSESIDACARAIQTLKARTADVPQSLIQLREMHTVPANAKAMLTSFLSEQSEELGVPEANAYEFQSGGVITMLEKLTAKFKDQLLALEKAEMSAKANYEMLLQQLQDNVKEDKKTTAAKTKVKADRLDDAATAKGDLATTEATKAEDEKALQDATAECQARSDEFEKNQVTRAAEVEAIEKAMEILSSSSVAGHAETYLPTLLQVRGPGATSLAQLQGGKTLESAVRQRASEFLQARAEKLGSRFLSLAAARAAADPFIKVKKMIKEMIVKLTEQANSEADAHAYCTTELSTNKLTRENKAAEVEELTAKSEQLAAEIAKLSSEIQELTDAIAELKGQQAEATNIRAEEKATNAKTVADAKEAQVAVEKATEVLRDYYSKAADASFLQSVQGSHAGEDLRAEMAQAVRTPYTGQQGASTGVLGMLEVILSDFARLEADTSSAEEAAATTYASFMAETNESVAVKKTEVDHKTRKRQLTDETLLSVKKELALTQDELDEASKYYDQLKAQCVETGLSYAERVRAREEEIQSLKEALDILHQSDLS